MTPVNQSHAHLTSENVDLLSPDRLDSIHPTAGSSALGALFQDAAPKPEARQSAVSVTMPTVGSDSQVTTPVQAVAGAGAGAGAPPVEATTEKKKAPEMSDEQRTAMEKEMRQYQNQFFRIPSFRRDQQRMDSSEINQVVRMQRFMVGGLSIVNGWLVFCGWFSCCCFSLSLSACLSLMYRLLPTTTLSFLICFSPSLVVEFW
jgi:hypothetical protein